MSASSSEVTNCRLLIATAGGHGEGTAVSARLQAMAEGLGQRGWQVELVRKDLDLSRARSLRHSLPRTVRDWLEDAGAEGDIQPLEGLALAPRLLRGPHVHRADVVLISVPPFSLLAVAVAVSMVRTVVGDVRDAWSSAERPAPLARALRPIETLALRRAAAVTYAGSPRLGQRLQRLARLPASQVGSVPNGVREVDLAGLLPPSSAPRKGPLDLVVAGQFYGRHQPGPLIDVLNVVTPLVARLTVVGATSWETAAGWMLHDPASLRLVETMPRRKLYERLLQADAGILAVGDGYPYETSLPVKAYEYLALGVPVVCVAPSGAAVLELAGAERFHHFEPGSVDQMAEFLRTAARDRGVLRRGGLDPVSYSRADGVDALHMVLTRTMELAAERVTRPR